jgi:uncharacterized membrane protein YfcA
MIAAVFLLAGTVKGVIGGGLPTIGIGLMGLVIAPAQAAALIVLPSLITNIWQSTGTHFVVLLKRLWLVLAGICVGSYFTAGILTGSDAGIARAGLGLALIIYAAFGLSRIRFALSPSGERWLALPVGLATGAIGAATGVFVIPSGPYLQAIGLGKNDLVQGLGLTYTVSTIALGATLAHGGAIQTSVALPSALALVMALIGMALGQKIRARVREQTFLTMFFIGLMLIGGYLTLREVL